VFLAVSHGDTVLREVAHVLVIPHICACLSQCLNSAAAESGVFVTMAYENMWGRWHVNLS
jgi:hypothetical protein